MSLTKTVHSFKFVVCIGGTALQLSPVQPLTDFVDASEVKNLIKSKRYFKGSCDFLEYTLDGVMHHDLALCALGGLIGHLSRLKVRLLLGPNITSRASMQVL